VALWTSHRIV
jgi:hypothetical protein